MNGVKVGIIGIGNIGSAHLRMITGGNIPDMTVTAVCDIDTKKLNAARNTYPALRVFEDYTDLLKNSDTNAVIIAVPHPLHAKIAIEAFKYGKHVLVEKPLDITVSAAEDLCAAAEKSGKVFAIMFNQRTNGLFRKAREIVKSGELGEIKRSVWIITNWYRTQSYYDSSKWRATWAGEGGGVLLNQCPHQLDLLQWLCGMPVKVRAFCHEGKWHDIEVEDDVTAYMEFENGATGVFVTTTADAPGTNRLELTFEMGKIVCEEGRLFFDKLSTNVSDFCKTEKEGFKKPEYSRIEIETDGQNEQHIGVLKAFAGHILRGTPLVAEGTEGIRGLTLSNAMHLSSWLDRTVELPLDEELFLRELNKKRATSRKKEDTDIVFDMTGTY